MLRTAFHNLVRNQSDLVLADDQEDSKKSRRLFHLQHCFDYLRQSIICSMDTTIEYSTSTGTSVSETAELRMRPDHINGWGLPISASHK